MLEFPIGDQNVAFFGLLTPSGLRSSTGPQQGPTGTSCTRILIHHDLCATLRSGCARRTQKETNNKAHKTLYFSYVWGRPRAIDCYDFWLSPTYRRLINRAKFQIDRFRGFGLRRGQSLGLPYRKVQWPYTTVCYTNVQTRDMQYVIN